MSFIRSEKSRYYGHAVRMGRFQVIDGCVCVLLKNGSPMEIPMAHVPPKVKSEFRGRVQDITQRNANGTVSVVDTQGGEWDDVPCTEEFIPEVLFADE